MKNPRVFVFPLRWSMTLHTAFDLHWTQRARADRLTRQEARDVLRQLAPTLTIPPGHLAVFEAVFIPPTRRKLCAVRLREHVCAVRSGLADALGVEIPLVHAEHRQSKVLTPRGEVLVRLWLEPVKGGGDS